MSGFYPVPKTLERETHRATKKDTRPRYPGVCPYCGTLIHACMSIAQQIGWHNSGVGTCYKCKKYFHLTFNVEKKEFDTETMEDFREKITKKQKDTVF
jgi:hypothetical protein